MHFAGCEFLESHVKETALSSWKKCVFKNCRWFKSKFSSVHLEGCRFTTCDFEHVLFEEVNFKNSHFRHITVSGSFHTVLFDGCQFENFDFSASSFHELGFLDAKLGSSFLGPSTHENIVVHDPADLNRWVAAVKTQLGSETASLLQADVDFLRSTGRPICVDLDAFEELPESDRPKAMAIGKSLVNGSGSKVVEE